MSLTQILNDVTRARLRLWKTFIFLTCTTNSETIENCEFRKVQKQFRKVQKSLEFFKIVQKSLEIFSFTYLHGIDFHVQRMTVLAWYIFLPFSKNE